MSRFVRSVPAVLALVLGGSACSQGTMSAGDLQQFAENPATFVATLTPADGAETTASGTAEFTFDGTTVEYVIRASDIDGVTAAHIHHGTSRIVIVPFHVDSPTPDTAGVLVQGTFTAEDVSQSSPVPFPELIGLMTTGGVYLNVHTEEHTGGEIRGSIAPRTVASP